MQKLANPMRESMPHFVCALRQVDEWKRFQARQSQVVAQAAYDVNAKYIKSPFAKSLKLDDVVRFLDDSTLDIAFMVQLPSIEKCLDQWWKVYGKHEPVLEPDQFRQVYYDLANVLVQAKTENTHKNSVSMIMRAAWTKWSVKEPPLTQREFSRVLFVLAHLMTESNRLEEYVTFLQETLAKIVRVAHHKHRRSEQRKRPPRVHRKSSLVEIMGVTTDTASRSRTASTASQYKMMRMLHQGEEINGESAIQDQDTGEAGTSGGGSYGSVRRVVSLQTSRSSGGGVGVDGSWDLDDACADQFVEVLHRHGSSNSPHGTTQHIIIDPPVLERRFQDKWKRPAHARTLSTEDALRERHPRSNKYVPPLSIARLYTSPTVKITGASAGVRGLLNHHCHSTSALPIQKSYPNIEFDLDAELKAVMAARDDREDQVLRRSLSAVTLKHRIIHNKAQAKLASTDKTTRKKTNTNDHNQNHDSEATAPIYLAITT